MEEVVTSDGEYMYYRGIKAKQIVREGCHCFVLGVKSIDVEG